jgi:AcrR family transcriptional regulator
VNNVHQIKTAFNMDDKSLKQQREDFTRQAIVDAARAIIVKQGRDALSMRGLAKAIGYSPGAIYKYFDSKEAIIQAIREEGYRLNADIQAGSQREGLSTLDLLIEAGRAFQRFPMEYPEHYLLMYGTADVEPMSADDIFHDEGFRGLAGMLQGLADAGEIDLRGYTAEELALHVWFLSHGIAMLRITLLRDSEEFVALSEHILELFARSTLTK